MSQDTQKHVYIIGSKGIPAKYGGFETFVEKLTEHQTDNTIQYHVACMNTGDNGYGNGARHFTHNGADCFNIKVSDKIGPARAIFYDLKALDYAIKLAVNNNIDAPIFYVLACRIGPFIGTYVKRIHAIGGQLFVNPDGHEWLRAKWSAPVRKYWRTSERLMVKHADLLICDSKTIEAYIQEDYAKYRPKTTYIAYGADISPSSLTNEDEQVRAWYREKGVQPDEYYLVVGRFVPENNYETMIREFMASTTTKDLVLITNVEHNKFYEQLKQSTGFEHDPRIKFVGTVYDQELLKKIREHAFGYLHGHEVGGTNPSLIEALGSTDLNLLLDVGFNREVGEDGALYWNKEKGHLAHLIDELGHTKKHHEKLGQIAKQRIEREFSWGYIDNRYNELIN
jgi:rhamnosyltransferase